MAEKEHQRWPSAGYYSQSESCLLYSNSIDQAEGDGERQGSQPPWNKNNRPEDQGSNCVCVRACMCK